MATEKDLLQGELARLLDLLHDAAGAQARVMSLVDALPEGERDRLRFESLRDQCIPRLNFVRNMHGHLHATLCQSSVTPPPRPSGRPSGLTKWA